MSKHFIGNAIKAYAVIYRIQYKLRGIHENGINIGKGTACLLYFALLHMFFVEIQYLLTTVCTNPFTSIGAKHICLAVRGYNTEVLDFLKASSALVYDNHADGASPVFLLAHKHGTKV